MVFFFRYILLFSLALYVDYWLWYVYWLIMCVLSLFVVALWGTGYIQNWEYYMALHVVAEGGTVLISKINSNYKSLHLLLHIGRYMEDISS